IGIDRSVMAMLFSNKMLLTNFFRKKLFNIASLSRLSSVETHINKINLGFNFDQALLHLNGCTIFKAEHFWFQFLAIKFIVVNITLFDNILMFCYFYSIIPFGLIMVQKIM